MSTGQSLSMAANMSEHVLALIQENNTSSFRFVHSLRSVPISVYPTSLSAGPDYDQPLDRERVANGFAYIIINRIDGPCRHRSGQNDR